MNLVRALVACIGMVGAAFLSAPSGGSGVVIPPGDQQVPMTEVSHMTLDGHINFIDIHRSRAYVVTTTDFYILDVSQPAAPTVMSETAQGTDTSGVCVQGNLAYLTHYYTNQMAVWDVTDPVHPAELGSIDVKQQWQGDKLTAQFTVDRPETLQILQREVPALERSLGQAGVNVDSGSLSFSLRQQQGNGKGNGEGFNQAAANAGLGDDGEPGAGDAPLGQVIRDGILSIRV